MSSVVLVPDSKDNSRTEVLTFVEVSPICMLRCSEQVLPCGKPLYLGNQIVLQIVPNVQVFSYNKTLQITRSCKQ